MVRGIRYKRLSSSSVSTSSFTILAEASRSTASASFTELAFIPSTELCTPKLNHLVKFESGGQPSREGGARARQSSDTLGIEEGGEERWSREDGH
ncbi:Os06g0665650 [Oryza sativa Japonica Group]|uniref:Os06g0665650 protein n=1 Tax=Oryza sativa subsp. japonica TaxID=39947 RepID=A0A0P0WZN9_ORYSJ|nr:Os06g0665650 [Oryza sativa Japonica Group]